MNLAKLIDCGVLFAAAGGIAGIFCEFFSLFRPFYYAHLAAVFCFLGGFLAGICYAVYRRADMKRAAGRLDAFGLKERMLTAYENMDKEDEVSQLQRQDAFVQYERIREQVRIPLFPGKRHILALFLSAVVAAGLSLLPSAAREQAALRHQVREEAKEEKEELEEFLEVLQSVDMERLTEEQRERLRELAGTMELARKELDEADSWESLSGVTQRLDYKYGQAAQSLAQLAGEMPHPETAGVADAEAFAKAAANRNGQQAASAGTLSGSGRGGENDSGDGSGRSGGDGKRPGSGDSNGDGSSGGLGGGDSSGDGSGGEDGSSKGDSQGNGKGSGSGEGTGNGRGEGHSDTAHDYVSVPGKTGDDASLTGNKNGDRDSDYYRDKNGLAWEGDHVEYSSVIGEYTDSAYEGIANGKYPEGMESVIRDYFEQLNK